MKAILIIAALVVAPVAIAAPAEAASKHKRHHSSGHARASIPPQPRIACTQFGCIPVRPGCYPAQGRTYSGLPSDFDVVVCPGVGTLYGIR